MAKQRSRYVCRDCGHESLAWAGQCPGCSSGTRSRRSSSPRVPRRRPAARSANADRPSRARCRCARSSHRGRSGCGTGIGELDRVLGGGLVPGSLVLLGGSPGIGKSTITAMALGNLAGAGRQVLYVTGEESTAQVRMRAERLGGGALDVPGPGRDRPRGGDRGDRDRAARRLRRRLRPDAALGRTDQRPGSVAQVREAANGLMEVAKRNGTASCSSAT